MYCKGITFCLKCGAWASDGPEKLVNVCQPATAAGKKQPLIEIVTDEWVAGAADAEIYIGTQNGIGTSGLEFGTLTPGTWYRVAIVVNMEELWGRIYIDGLI